MQAGTHGEALHRVAARLRAELTDPAATDLPGVQATLREKGGMTRILDAEGEALVTSLREALAAIASTLGAGVEDPHLQAIETTLDGAEFVIRSELLGDEPERLPKLIPSFVFLVALAVTDRRRALELSRRAAELIAEAAP